MNRGGTMVTERRKTVLIVDDESLMVSLLQRHITNAGYDFDVASNGQEALDKISKNPPDAVLLDLMMPGLNGFETCRRIRANEKTKKLPVIIVTALHSESDSSDAAGCGANEFLTKPVDGAVLAKRLKHYIGSPFRV
jgi:DNA-binding response OmpR family regulator